jgi:hypothetical protein
VAEQSLVESLLGLLDREIDKAVEDRLAAYKLQFDKRVLRQFENIVLRYEDPQQWRNFLVGLKKRGKLRGILEKFSEWLASEEDSPANNCLKGAAQILSELHYGETSGGTRRNLFPPLEEESWQPIAATLKKQLYPVTLRELLLRAVKRALYES